ncbi:MAG: ferritin-like domain-containing protein [Sphingopyxis sp.]|nr:ferritin-like domain-containing protein [Sphingopyxis sp.]
MVVATRSMVRAWRAGKVIWAFDGDMPSGPLRPSAPVLLPPRDMPKRGRAGSLRSRIAMLHALAHIEFVAIALALDMAARFGDGFPKAFADDWLSVAADEAMHFALLNRRLHQLGSGYGALPAHDGLWETAERTAHDPMARLAIVPMVLEARGLDVTPATIARFESAGDGASAAMLGRIYRDEIRHVSIGTRWFEWCCAERQLESTQTWQKHVNQGFRGALQGPFNHSARDAAGLTQDYMRAVA